MKEKVKRDTGGSQAFVGGGGGICRCGIPQFNYSKPLNGARTYVCTLTLSPLYRICARRERQATPPISRLPQETHPAFLPALD